MKNVAVTIRPTDVRSVVYENKFSGKPGEPMKIQVKNNAGVKLNPAQPTMAVVGVKFEAKDEADTIRFELETVTAVQVSTFVDNLDDMIKENYMSTIMMAVNEKIRTVASMVGMNIAIPPIKFERKDSSNSIDAEIFRA
ncbi:MAG: hypothetical protein MJ105_02140 [Lachnospiraceae bacterium]|nr:hypothetical protein [Lachnospiraceae bacterium]